MYGMFDERAYLRELQKKKNLIPYEQSITDPYYAQLALKQEPQIAGEPDIADLNAIRSLVRADISKYIKTADQVSFAVEELDRSNDLVNFYRFHKAFDTSIKGVRGLDASFFLQLWDKFKSNVLASKRVAPVEQQPVAYQPTEAQYRQAINRVNMGKEDTLLHRGFNPETQLPYQHVPVPEYFGFELPPQPIAVSPGLPLKTMTPAWKKASGAARRAKKQKNKQMATEILPDIFNETQFGPAPIGRPGRPTGSKNNPKPRITLGGALKKKTKPKKRAKKLTKIHFV